jgi:hypothetical protein
MTEIDNIISKGFGKAMRALTPKERTQRKAAARSKRKGRVNRVDAARSAWQRSPKTGDKRIMQINARNYTNMKMKSGMDDPTGQTGDAHSRAKQAINRRRYERRQSRGA